MTPRGKWHKEYLMIEEFGCGLAPKKAAVRLARLASEKMKTLSDEAAWNACGSNAWQVISEYIYTEIGRPRWFISKEMFNLLCDVDVDILNLERVFFPYDVMCFCFERGCMLTEGVPCRSVMIDSMRSDISKKLIHDVLCDIAIHDGVELQDNYLSSLGAEIERKLSIKIDFGWVSAEGRYIDDSEYSERRCIRMDGTYNMDSLDLIRGTSKDRAALGCRATKIAIAALLYHAARPEWCVPYAMERSDRYHHSQPRENMRKLLLPSVKYIRENAPHLDTPEYHTKPHYRGFVLRTLRSPIYYKDKPYPPEHWRTVLVPPCAIHPELMEKE